MKSFEEIFEKVKADLSSAVTPTAAHLWFEPLKYVYFEKDTFIIAVRDVGLWFVSAGHGQNLLEKRQTDVHWRTEKGRGTRTLDLLSQ